MSDFAYFIALLEGRSGGPEGVRRAKVCSRLSAVHVFVRNVHGVKARAPFWGVRRAELRSRWSYVETKLAFWAYFGPILAEAGHCWTQGGLLVLAQVGPRRPPGSSSPVESGPR